MARIDSPTVIEPAISGVDMLEVSALLRAQSGCQCKSCADGLPATVSAQPSTSCIPAAEGGRGGLGLSPRPYRQTRPFPRVPPASG